MNTRDTELPPLRLPDLEDELTAVLRAAISWGGSVISSDEYVAAKQRFRAAVNSAIEADRKRRGEPVAWAMFADNGNIRIWARKPISHPDCVPLYTAPQPAEPIVSDVEAIVRLLESREWAEHVATTPLGQRLETAVTVLVGADQQLSEPVKVPSVELQGLADRAYCQYLEQMRRPECKGVEYKLENHKFGVFELAAHNKAYEHLGRYKAFSEAAALLARYGQQGQPIDPANDNPTPEEEEAWQQIEKKK